MNNSQKILKMLSSFVEAGILTSQDIKKELITSMKFNRDNLANKLDLVTREEFVILKKIIEKQQKEIKNLKNLKNSKKLKKFKKFKKAKKS
ncbi:MAG: hypothetical protein CMI79_06310 [Candidatus Pelagibacter sp.]|mgnify:CR=1 FL=1|nr:hypothetical protein [Candidatus Pelagibacter sp.]